MVPIHLDSGLEHPDLKTDFKHPLPKWAFEQGPSLIWSALTLIRAWVVAGRPEGKKTLGKFESWATVIGGILQVAKVPGFLERLEEFRTRADTETAKVRDFIEAWAAKFGCREVRVSDLMPLAAPLDLGDGNPLSQSTRLGKLLAERQGQQLRGWRVEKRRMVSGHQQWRLWQIVDASASGGDALTLPIESQPAPPLELSTTSPTSTTLEMGPS
jgi:hypothetical protein